MIIVQFLLDVIRTIIIIALALWLVHYIESFRNEEILLYLLGMPYWR